MVRQKLPREMRRVLLSLTTNENADYNQHFTYFAVNIKLYTLSKLGHIILYMLIILCVLLKSHKHDIIIVM